MMLTEALLVTLIAFSPRDCPEIFGDVEDVEENASLRKSELNFILDEAPFAVVDHSSDWEEPVLTEVRSVELIDTSTAGPTAYLSLAASREGFDCEDGVYDLHVDDAFGEDGRVIAILDGVLLVEIDAELRYLLTDDGTKRDWRMTWSSSYSMKPYMKKGTRLRKRTRRSRRARRRRK